ncbi:MAG: beta-Ala-His dipeptidase [Halioglobus sp.]
MKPENYPQEPAHIWEHFYQITQIPRPSKQEEAVRQYVINLAEELGHLWRMDGTGNLVIYVAATEGLADREAVTIQNHLDMVTVKTEDRAHDFETDPLQLEVVDGWLKADRTTLGADNGLGCAAALAVMTDPDVAHPALELLFTVDEETGLGGALNLDASLLHGTRMLNLDTEEWNELYIGCTGGGGWEFRRSLETEPVPAGLETWKVSLKGLAGGHSGIQIHQQLGNAIKLLGQFLHTVEGLRLSAFDAGVAHNVIPREASAVFACGAGNQEGLLAAMEAFREQWLSYLPESDHGLALLLQPGEASPVLSEAASGEVLDLIAIFPHGAQSYSSVQPADLVDTSINFAVLQLVSGELFLEASFRFFNEGESQPLRLALEALARAFGLKTTPVVGYPGWQPDFDSPLLAQGVAIHRRLFGGEPAIKAIHAGLECGILKSKKPNTDILSFGPTIRGAHSPTERLQIDTVPPFWQLLTELLVEM